MKNRNYKYTKDGVIVGDRILFKGFLETSLNGGSWEGNHNILPYEGLDYLFNTALNSGVADTTFYIAPFAANVTPTSALTGANFASTQTEFINYTQVTRQAWVEAGSTNGVISNVASPATITIGAGGQTTVYGAAILSSSAISSVTGICLACSLLGTARTGLISGDALGFRYTLTMTST